ncbi:MAG: hypothetical protein LH632_15495 [Rhodoferax sp.]|nr:hypothetical protein [Rhodoferax sp.]
MGALRRFFPRVVLTRPWLTFSVMCSSFRLFGAGTRNIFSMFSTNWDMITQQGLMALAKGSLRQLLELLGTFCLAMFFYMIFKACEHPPVRPHPQHGRQQTSVKVAAPYALLDLNATALSLSTGLTWRRWLVAAKLHEYWDDPLKQMKLEGSAEREVEQEELLSAGDLQLGAVTCSTCYQQILDMFERFDLVAFPTAQVWPFEATLERPKSIGGRSVQAYQ